MILEINKMGRTPFSVIFVFRLISLYCVNIFKLSQNEVRVYCEEYNECKIIEMYAKS